MLKFINIIQHTNYLKFNAGKRLKKRKKHFFKMLRDCFLKWKTKENKYTRMTFLMSNKKTFSRSKIYYQQTSISFGTLQIFDN